MSKKIDRTGEEKLNNQGCLMKIIKYNNAQNIVVEFQDKYKYKVNSKYNEFKNGSIKNNFYPSVCGKGYIGNAVTKINGVKKKSYEVWHKMLQRCYSEKVHKNRPTYENCEVCKDWLCYEVFERWFSENYYEIEDETIELDKDWIVKNNKLYSSETCVFSPQRINTLIIKSNSVRGKYPIGVYWHKKEKKFNVSLNINGKNIIVGRFDTPEEAFKYYKEAKENEIKRIAELYKDKIPQRLYEAMYLYQVEITD